MAVLRKIFGKYLLITNTVSCGLMMGIGDLIQQRSEYWRRSNNCNISTSVKNGNNSLLANIKDLEEASYTHNYMRMKNMITVGLLQGPFHHYFYAALERFIPGRNAKSIVKKTLLDQSIASPTCLIIFFVGIGLLEHQKIQAIYEELKLKLCDTWKVDCCFWPPTQSINFCFVPLRYRVLYTNFMTMVYDIFLSYMKYDACYE